MKKHKIHQSNEEKLASTSEGTFSALNENIQKTDAVVKAVKEVKRSIDNKSDMIGGFTGVLKSLKKNTDTMNELKENINEPKGVVRKLEEMKSASLITNQELKKLNKKETPAVQKIELMGAELVTIKGAKGDKGDKGETGPIGKTGAEGKQGLDGKDGKMGEKGPKGDKGDEGKRGNDGRDGTNGKDGNDGSPDTPDEVVEKVNIAKKKIEPKAIKGLLEMFSSVDQIVRFPQGSTTGGANALRFNDSTGSQISAYVSALQFGTGLTPTYSSGVITITSSGSGLTTASNGLTASGTNVKLGGLLTENTTIDGNSGTYDMTFTGIETYLVSAINNFTTGSTSSYFGSPSTTINGSTTLRLQTPNVVALTATAGQILTLTNATTGVVEYRSPTNGLTGTTSGIKLGGTLIEDTTIAGGNFNLTINALADMSVYAGTFQVRGTAEVLYLNTSARIARLGDYNTVGNGTKINIEDATGYMELKAPTTFQLKTPTSIAGTATVGQALVLSNVLTGACDWATISGGVTTMGTFGATPNANGASISGATLTLQPADATNPGGVSTTTQTFAGAKTLSSAPTFSSLTTNGGLFYGNGSGTLQQSGAITGIIKGNGTSAPTAATSGTDYVPGGAVTTNGITMTTARLLGRTTASTGAVEEITVGSGLTLASTSLKTSTAVEISLADRYVGATTSGTTEELVYSLLIPAGTMGANDSLYVKSNSTTNSATSHALRYYFNTSSSLSGATQWAQAGAPSNQIAEVLVRTIRNTGATNTNSVNTPVTTNQQSDESGYTNNTYTTLTIDFSVDQYMIISTAGGSSNSTLRNARVVHRKYI